MVVTDALAYVAWAQSDENPVFYVQYAHARICSIVKFGQDKSITFEKNPELSLLDSEEELDLIKHLILFPATIEKSAHYFEPHRLVHYLIDTATLFHKFYTICRVISDDTQLTQARLALSEATRVVIYNGCQILGITAPEKM